MGGIGPQAADFGSQGVLGLVMASLTIAQNPVMKWVVVGLGVLDLV